MDVSENRGTPKSSILIGFSIINHPFWGFSPYFWKHPYNNYTKFRPVNGAKTRAKAGAIMAITSVSSNFLAAEKSMVVS